MNQILDYGAGNNDNNSGKSKKNNNYGGGNFGGGNNYNSGNKSPMSDKVVKIFALIMIILAIALIASGAMSMLKNKKDVDKSKASSSQSQPAVQAEILAELNDITGKVKININNEIPISKIIYVWDQGRDNVIAGEKKTTFETEIDSEYGEHILHIQVTDEKNNKTTKDFTINSVTGVDTTEPTVKLEITSDPDDPNGNKKLLITATDDTSIAYVTYTWTNEDTGEKSETVTMTPEEENPQEYSFYIEIPEGKNSIVVVAIDGSELSNVTTASKVLEGVKIPEISHAFINGTEKVVFIFKHDSGIQSVDFIFNGQAYQYTVPEGEEPQKELQFEFPSIQGENVLYMKVTSCNGYSNEWTPSWEYDGGVASDEGTGEPGDEPVNEPQENEGTDDSEVSVGSEN